MKVKCEYCDNYIDDSEEKCSGCGAPNKNYKRVGNQVPTTIEELEKWYKDRNLPPYETTRFFIGIDYKEPRAFGIYKDVKTGKFVVYKNKDTGERVIRYEGKDEKYAVNELYLKLKEEIVNQKSRIPRTTVGGSKSNSLLIATIIVIFFLFFIFVIANSSSSPSRGYYNINGSEYYYVHGGWYAYRDNDWRSSNEPYYSGDLDDYYDGYNYSGSDKYSDIEKSDVYDSSWDSSSSSDNWDSGSDWDSGSSWDSGGTDWSSDW